MMDAMMLRRDPIGRLDVALAVLLTGLGVVMMVENVTDSAIDASPLAIPLFLAVTVPLIWRRAAPVAALAMVTVAVAAHVALFGTITRCGVVIPVGLLLAYAAAVRLDKHEALIALGAACVALSVMLVADDAAGPEAITIILPLVAAVWAGGRLVRSRSALAGELDERNVALRQARDERARLEVVADRAKLSAELDELLHRRLADLARLADSGANAADAGGAAAAFADIERESRSTLEQMRAVVGVLRHDEAGSPMAPQPTLTSLEGLLVHAKGADARLSFEGSPRTLPAGVELSAYRVVEHLLDALDDAPDVVVRVRFDDEALELSVSGPLRHRGDAQRSIERARERVALHRGTLEATLRSGRADAVASLPVATGA